MIAVDTNVLVRFLVEDDPDQTAIAAAVVERAIDSAEPLFVPQIVLCELVWVLSHAYKFSRSEILNVLQQLRRGAQITLERSDEIRRAIESFATGRGDFPDYLIAERAAASGCTTVVTFDRALYADPRFSPPTSARG
jgi:predicted nucleic-acid-binding protein